LLALIASEFTLTLDGYEVVGAGIVIAAGI